MMQDETSWPKPARHRKGARPTEGLPRAGKALLAALGMWEAEALLILYYFPGDLFY